jgi:hypothetical protein
MACSAKNYNRSVPLDVDSLNDEISDLEDKIADLKIEIGDLHAKLKIAGCRP